MQLTVQLLNSTITLNKGDVIDVRPDFKLDIAATSLYLFQGTEVMITDGGNNIQFDWEVVAILKLDNYTRAYFSNKNTKILRLETIK